jgi:AraC-like DNA-binding protein
MTAPSFTIARGLGPLPRMLEAARGTPAVERVFRSEGVPLGITQDQNSKLPLHTLMALIERSAREVGDGLFGLSLGAAIRPEDFGPVVRYMLAAPDLRTLLRRSMRAVAYQQSGTEFSLEICNGLARWGYRVIEPICLGRRHHSDHVIMPMLAGLRRYLGRGWVPTRVEVEYDRFRGWRDLERQFDAPVIFGAKTNAIVFESCLLNRACLCPIALADLVTFRDLRRSVSERPPRTQAEAVRELIHLRLLDSVVDIDGAGKLLGLGSRTLQRRLAAENVTYRDIVEQTRMARAFDLLGETSQPITSIALSLGYGDIASFSRAFQRWAGFPPSHYRRARRPGQSLGPS